jgi:hypothetical protein
MGTSRNTAGIDKEKIEHNVIRAGKIQKDFLIDCKVMDIDFSGGVGYYKTDRSVCL